MKCFMCGSEYRITIIKDKAYCFRCESDYALEQYRIVRPMKRKAS